MRVCIRMSIVRLLCGNLRVRPHAGPAPGPAQRVCKWLATSERWVCSVLHFVSMQLPGHATSSQDAAAPGSFIPGRERRATRRTEQLLSLLSAFAGPARSHPLDTEHMGGRQPRAAQWLCAAAALYCSSVGAHDTGCAAGAVPGAAARQQEQHSRRSVVGRQGEAGDRYRAAAARRRMPSRKGSRTIISTVVSGASVQFSSQFHVLDAWPRTRRRHRSSNASDQGVRHPREVERAASDEPPLVQRAAERIERGGQLVGCHPVRLP